ncbi:MAG: hypothetical protein ACXQTJ_00930 [Candidatus Syntropharchaeales archaeon]
MGEFCCPLCSKKIELDTILSSKSEFVQDIIKDIGEVERLQNVKHDAELLSICTRFFPSRQKEGFEFHEDIIRKKNEALKAANGGLQSNIRLIEAKLNKEKSLLEREKKLKAYYENLVNQ